MISFSIHTIIISVCLISVLNETNAGCTESKTKEDDKPDTLQRLLTNEEASTTVGRRQTLQSLLSNEEASTSDRPETSQNLRTSEEAPTTTDRPETSQNLRSSEEAPTTTGISDPEIQFEKFLSSIKKPDIDREMKALSVLNERLRDVPKKPSVLTSGWQKYQRSMSQKEEQAERVAAFLKEGEKKDSKTKEPTDEGSDSKTKEPTDEGPSNKPDYKGKGKMV